MHVLCDSVFACQWRTQKMFMGVSFSGIWWSFVFGVRCLWRHNLMSYLRFQTNVLAKFVDIMCIYFSRTPLYKLSAFQARVSVENKLNATTQQFVNTKISVSALKQGSKTHSSLYQRNFQLQNEAALCCRIRAVEHRKCAAGLAGAHPG